jgi:3D (Asp-Asp-Asp) domain-containing protein
MRPTTMKNSILQATSKVDSYGRIIFSLILVIFSFNMNFPHLVTAASAEIFPKIKEEVEPTLKAKNEAKIDFLTQRFIENEGKKRNITKDYNVVRTMRVVATAYSSTVDQCDDTPCITANGFNVCNHGKEDVIAANFLRFGTKVRIPELYGDRIFTVQDRMNPKYDERIDL